MAKAVLTQVPSERVSRARAIQAALLAAHEGQSTAARLCPFCYQKVSLIYPGYHGPARMKCPNCGEEVFFPSISLKKPRTGRVPPSSP